jgi:hypothetical protein
MGPEKQEIADVPISKTVTSYEPQRVQNDGTYQEEARLKVGNIY